MENWILFSILSMIFAGITSILAKFGLKDISAEAGLGVRTAVIFSIITFICLKNDTIKEIQTLSKPQFGFLVLSGIATSLSWIFYYKAIKEGLVSYVSAIDKGSIVITVLLSFWLLGEPISLKIILGTCFITAGMLILVWK
ncbi:EamA family transporter [Leptospira sp. 'Mane']|uniref:EamA family transporter n=1 Tax=Leptospira sp. 'Mane' TaxID=3387407 RepID=UPI00398AE8CD